MHRAILTLFVIGYLDTWDRIRFKFDLCSKRIIVSKVKIVHNCIYKKKFLNFY